MSSSKVKILAFVGIVFLVAAIVGIAVFVVEWNDKNTIMKHGHFGVIIDAGGTGSRLYVYEYRSKDDIKQVFVKECEEKGLSHYKDPSDLKPLLTQCLHEAEQQIPEDVAKSTPLFMKATAGMRKLKLQNETQYNSIWSQVRRILNNGSFPVSTVDTMSGKDEGTFSWTTVNQLFGNKETKGIIEIGSTSTQIAFAPSSNTNLPNEYSSEVSINGENYKIYATSYLCLGKEEYMRRYYAELVRDSNYTVEVENPCGNQGYNLNLTKEYLWQEPCVQGNFAKTFLGEDIPGNSKVSVYTLKGTSDYGKCQSRIENMLNSNCTNSNCGMFNVYQPQAFGKYTAIGGAAYYAASFLELPTHFNLTTFKNHLKELCESNVEQVKKRPGFGSYSLTYCLSNSLTSYILSNVVKVNMTIPGNFMFSNKINGNKVSWTLGSLIQDKDNLSPAQYETTRGLSDSTFTALMVIFGVICLAGILMIVVSFVSSRS